MPWDVALLPLTLLAWLYAALVCARASLYRVNILKTRRVGCRVVSIGNLTVGGTGKTPITIFFAEHYRRQGQSVGIVSRGYGRRDTSAVLPVSDGKRILTTCDAAGDEPYLMAERLPEIPVVVAADRHAGCQWLMAHGKTDVILLDDGFQHLALHRDMNVLLLDAARPFGNGALLPRGALRETPSAMRRADVVIFTRADNMAATPLPSLSCPILTSTFEATALVSVCTGALRALDALAGRPVFALCGIARPDAFFHLLSRLGARVLASAAFPDHHDYTTRDLTTIRKRAGSLWIVATEKDAVKIRRLLPGDLDVWALRIEARLSEGWEAVLGA